LRGLETSKDENWKCGSFLLIVMSNDSEYIIMNADANFTHSCVRYETFGRNEWLSI
jgi:hypothetical protein